MASGARKTTDEQVTRFADMFSAIGTEPRLRIMRVRLSAHPTGMVVGDIGAELGIASFTLSHHLDKLRNEDLVNVRREGTFLWYSANAEALQELLGFLAPVPLRRIRVISVPVRRAPQITVEA